MQSTTFPPAHDERLGGADLGQLGRARVLRGGRRVRALPALTVGAGDAMELFEPLQRF
jgi:hypothetical protein